MNKKENQAQFEKQMRCRICEKLRLYNHFEKLGSPTNKQKIITSAKYQSSMPAPSMNTLSKHQEAHFRFDEF